MRKNIAKKNGQESSASVDSGSQKGLENATTVNVAQSSTNVQNSSVSNNNEQQLPQTGGNHQNQLLKLELQCLE